MKKIIFIIPLILSSLVSCGKYNLSHIEDTNGKEDTSLVTLSEKDLLTKHPHALFNLSSYSSKNNDFTFTCKIFSGVSDIKKFTISEDTTFKITAYIEEGNGDFFVYQDEKRIAQIGFPFDGNIIIPKSNKAYYFRIGGESASIKINITK